MQTELPTQPLPVVPVPVITVPPPAAPPRRRAVVLAVAVLALLAVAAGTVAALLPQDEPDPVGAALDRLRAWPSTTVDGYLTGGDEPLRVHATVTADGWAHGTVGRSRNATAGFVAGPGAALVRGNVEWWRGTDPARAAADADRWVSGVRDDAVDQFARGRLAPPALADALAGLRNPDERTEADVVVGGVPGRSFVRGGLRLVVGRAGAPLALTAPVTRATVAGFRAGPALGGTAFIAAVSVAPPSPADGDAARRAVADAARDAVATPAPTPRLDPTPRPGRVTIDAIPLAGGCPRTGCTLRYRVTNRGSGPTTGTFTLRVAGDEVTAVPMTLEPGDTVDVAARIPAALLAAHPRRTLEVAAAFRPDGGPTL